MWVVQEMAKDGRADLLPGDGALIYPQRKREIADAIFQVRAREISDFSGKIVIFFELFRPLMLKMHI